MNLPELLRRCTPLLLALSLAGGPVDAQSTTTRPSTTKTASARAEITATRHPFLWRIDGHGTRDFKAKSWLYGTMHLGDKRLITLPEEVNAARESADALYCELDMRKMGRSQLKLTKLMLLPKGQQLRDQLPPELYQRLREYLRRHGASIRRFKKLKVWAVNLTLATIDVTKLGFIHSLDSMIYDEAHRDGLEVGGLETIDEQMHAFTSLSTTDQIKALQGALALGEEYDDQGRSQLGEMLNAYLSGESAQLLAKVEESSRHNPELTERMMKLMLVDRNLRMADRMVEKLRTQPNKSYFFAVGAMHYPGEAGLLQLLRARGYRITRINPPVSPNASPQALADKVAALERRLEKMTTVLGKSRKEKALLEVRVRKLEFQVKALERRLR